MHRFAVILTHNRPELLRQTWAAIGPQVDVVIIIDNASEPAICADDFASATTGGTWLTAVATETTQPPNLSQMWLDGIEMAKRMWELNQLDDDDSTAPRPYVAVLCDDAPPPGGWFEAVTAAMAARRAEGSDCVIGCSAPQGYEFAGPPRVKTARDSDLGGRMPGWAWIVDPTYPVRPDPRFAYWWGDTDVDIAARDAGGMLTIGSHAVPNLVPNGWTGRMVEQIAVDSQRFVDKYGGWRPW